MLPRASVEAPTTGKTTTTTIGSQLSAEPESGRYVAAIVAAIEPKPARTPENAQPRNPLIYAVFWTLNNAHKRIMGD
jgi:hypothetical protein